MSAERAGCADARCPPNIANLVSADSTSYSAAMPAAWGRPSPKKQLIDLNPSHRMDYIRISDRGELMVKMGSCGLTAVVFLASFKPVLAEAQAVDPMVQANEQVSILIDQKPAKLVDRYKFVRIYPDENRAEGQIFVIKHDKASLKDPVSKNMFMRGNFSAGFYALIAASANGGFISGAWCFARYAPVFEFRSGQLNLVARTALGTVFPTGRGLMEEITKEDYISNAKSAAASGGLVGAVSSADIKGHVAIIPGDGIKQSCPTTGRLVFLPSR